MSAGVLDMVDSLGAFSTLLPILTIIYAFYLAYFIFKSEWGVNSGSNYNEFINSLKEQKLVAQSKPVSSIPLYSKVKKRFCVGSVTMDIMEHASGRPLGTVVWDGGIALCQYFSTLFGNQNHRTTEKRVLELGSGTGIVGIYMALLGFHVTLTDLPELVELMHTNVDLNCVQDRTHVFALEWGGSSHSPNNKSAEKQTTTTDVVYDMVIGADVLYVDRPVFLALHQTLLSVIGPQTICYLSGAKRHTFEDEYLDILKSDFDVQNISFASEEKPSTLQSPSSQQAEISPDLGIGLGEDRAPADDPSSSSSSTNQTRCTATHYRNPTSLYILKLTRRSPRSS